MSRTSILYTSGAVSNITYLVKKKLTLYKTEVKVLKIQLESIYQ